MLCVSLKEPSDRSANAFEITKILLGEFFAGDEDLAHHHVPVRGELPQGLTVKFVVPVAGELGTRRNQVLQEAITDDDIAIGTSPPTYSGNAV